MSVRKLALNGSRSSKISANGSRLRRKDRKLQHHLRSAFNRYQKLANSRAHQQARQDFIFHMTDWQDDLRRLAHLYAHPERYDTKIASEVVADFLMHALPHAHAAAELMLDYEGHPFGKG